MLTGYQCRYLSTTEDNQLQRRMGSMNREEFVWHLVFDAATPEQLDAIAFQLLCIARRCKTAGIKEEAAAWKAESKRVSGLADEARARLAAMPSRDSHPGFFNSRSVGRPGCLDSDLFLPYVFRLHAETSELYHAIYEPVLVNGTVYQVRGSRDLKTWIEPVGGDRAFPVNNAILKGLLTMGRIEALPLSAVALQKAA